MKKIIITISMTVAMVAFLSVGCGEDAATEPTEADEAESGQTTDNEEAGDPSKEESNNAEFGSEAGK
jgi:hypothetical protein